ncbi:MAG: glycerol-3-phosphate dehydrogenase/oxidase, partial [Candidatus Dormibacteraeota bacterium]|nr:glycerol-3-phosphate dehydrogenase/oxidase [Candidatus Dormibacteraeota bacterium]
MRADTLERLARETFDLVVVGGGIVGARIAYEAAAVGATTALIDAGDFGWATSSASSKLVHGGLRYLQMYDFDLVRESHHERRALLDTVAPHLVRPLTFVIPIYSGLSTVALVGAALLTYSGLSGFRHSQSRLVGPAGARALVPDLQTRGLKAAGVYEDAQTNDSRLVLATVAAASRAGATVLNHAPVTAIETLRGRVHGVRLDELLVRTRGVINAAGPWVDEVRRMEDPGAEPVARLSKGVHLVVDPPGPWRAAVTTMLEGGRATFAVPWEGKLLLGTTDTEYEGDPGAVSVLPEDVDMVLREASISMPPEVLDRSRIRYIFAGLRVLPRTAGSTAKAPRDELVRTGPAGMVSVAGGKLTTHRQIAVRVLRHLDAFRGIRVTDAPLPGAGLLPARPAGLDPEAWDHLTHLYGSDAGRV